MLPWIHNHPLLMQPAKSTIKGCLHLSVLADVAFAQHHNWPAQHQHRCHVVRYCTDIVHTASVQAVCNGSHGNHVVRSTTAISAVL